MIRVPLGIKRVARRFDVAGGPPVVVPVYRIVCPLLVGSDHRSCDAWIDTGSPLTVIPQRAWEAIADEIDWIDPAGGPPRTVAVAGLAHPCRLGRVPIAVIGTDLSTVLPAVTTTAMFAVDHDKIPAPLVGLWGGVLAGRRLVVEPDLASARLEAA